MNSSNSNNVDMRDAFFKGLYQVIESDKNVMVLTADHGAFGLNRIKEDFPNQYLNVGIAEQNMVSVAAGLALSGKIVYIYSIINFVTLRCLEQINIDIASMNLHINIVGVGAGFTYSTDGPTHHGTQDVAIMSVIPNLSIYNCSDAVNSNAFAKMGYENKGPKYIRIEKGLVPELYKQENLFEDGIAKVKNGNDTYILSSGIMIHKAIDAAKTLSKNDSEIGVLDLYRMKPINEILLVDFLSDVKKLLIIEDNICTGGLSEKVCSILMKNKMTLDMKILNVPDSFSFYYSQKREYVENQSGLSVAHIMEILTE